MNICVKLTTLFSSNGYVLVLWLCNAGRPYKVKTHFRYIIQLNLYDLLSSYVTKCCSFLFYFTIRSLPENTFLFFCEPFLRWLSIGICICQKYPNIHMQIKRGIQFMTPKTKTKKIFFMTLLQCNKHFSRMPEFHLLLFIRSYFEINLLVRCEYKSA